MARIQESCSLASLLSRMSTPCTTPTQSPRSAWPCVEEQNISALRLTLHAYK